MITIKVEGLGRVQHKLEGYARKIPQAGRRGMWLFTNRLASKIRLEAREKGHVSSGRLSSTKGTYAKKLDKDSWAIMMPYYTKYLEQGTFPHFIPRNRKTVKWARDHNMTFSRFKFGIAMQGTTPHPFTGRVINREIRELKRTIEEQINNTIKQTR